MQAILRRRLIVGVLAAGLLLFPGIALALPTAAAPQAAINQSITSVESTNWAGYVGGAGVGTVTKVSASWTEPTLTCSAGTQYAVFWVGIDGAVAPSTTVEQTGTLGECSGGVASYSAWWELYPLNDIQVIAGFTVHPGDKISASVTYAGGQFTLAIKDGSQKFSTKGSQAGVERNSAECIVERPSEVSGTKTVALPLANFKAMSFSACTATISGTSGPIGSVPAVYAVTMVSSGKKPHDLATVSALGTSGSSFTATWVASH